jgi:hypothetical protein
MLIKGLPDAKWSAKDPILFAACVPCRITGNDEAMKLNGMGFGCDYGERELNPHYRPVRKP